MAEKKEVEIYKKLFKIFKEFRTIGTDARNEYLKYNYASFNKIKEEIGKKLIEQEILFIFNTKFFINISTGEGFLTNIEYTAQFIDIESGKDLTITGTGQAYDKEGKGLAKAKTDAIKRLFTDTFLIGTEEEDEDATLGKTQPKSEPKPEPKMTQVEYMNLLLKKINDLNPDFYNETINVYKEQYGDKFPDNLLKDQYSKVIDELKKFLPKKGD